MEDLNNFAEKHLNFRTRYELDFKAVRVDKDGVIKFDKHGAVNDR